MNAQVYSSNVLILGQKDDGAYYPLACAESIEQSQTSGITQSFASGGDGWEAWAFNKRKSWNVTLRGLSLLVDTTGEKWTVAEIEDGIVNNRAVAIKFLMTGNDGVQLFREVSAFLTDVGISAVLSNGGELAMWNMSLKSSGPVKVITGNYNNWLWPSGTDMLWPSGDQMTIYNA